MSIRTILAALTIPIMIANLFAVASAQEANNEGTSVELNLLNIEGLVVSETITVDESYTDRWGGEVKAPFSIQVPKMDGATPLYHTPEEGFATLIRVSYATEDQLLIENVRITPMTIPMGPVDERLQIVDQLMRKQVLPAFVQGYDDPQYFLSRAIKVNTYDAVEVIATMKDATLGLIHVRLVGILNPDGPETMFAVSNVVDQFKPLTHPDQYPRTLSGYIIDHFEFISE